MISFGEVPAGSTLPIFFDTFSGTNGASITLTGLATSDIKIYKAGSTTERSSTAGFTLLDTDGIDFDSIAGIHGFSIDLSDNTDSGFYSVGSFFTVVVSSVTVDSQTVNFVAATFRIVEAETTAGRKMVHTAAITNGIIAAATFASNALDAVWSTATRLLTAGTNIVLAKGTGVTGFNDPTAAEITAAVLDEAIAGHLSSGTVGDAIFVAATGHATTQSDIAALNNISADDVWDEQVDGSVTARQSMRLSNSANGGKVSGAGTTNVLIRDLADTKNRVDATVDADGNRSAITRDLT